MLTLLKPKPAAVDAYLRDCREAQFTYDQIGATRLTQMPKGFNHDTHTIRLGSGRAVFDAAVTAFRDLQMFPREMLSLVTPNAQIRADEIVAIQFKMPIGWSVNACRIVYVIDDRNESAEAFGFGYGTLPGHIETGEERFLLEWDRDSDDVWYSIIAFSRLSHSASKIGYLYARYQQARFRRLSGNSMRLAVSTDLAQQVAPL